LLASYVDQDGQSFPFTAQMFSALKRDGIDEANDKILELAGLNVTTDEPTEKPDTSATR
jgi:GTP-binding protein